MFHQQHKQEQKQKQKQKQKQEQKQKQKQIEEYHAQLEKLKNCETKILDYNLDSLFSRMSTARKIFMDVQDNLDFIEKNDESKKLMREFYELSFEVNNDMYYTSECILDQQEIRVVEPADNRDAFYMVDVYDPEGDYVREQVVCFSQVVEQFQNAVKAKRPDILSLEERENQYCRSDNFGNN